MGGGTGTGCPPVQTQGRSFTTRVHIRHFLDDNVDEFVVGDKLTVNRRKEYVSEIVSFGLVTLRESSRTSIRVTDYSVTNEGRGALYLEEERRREVQDNVPSYKKSQYRPLLKRLKQLKAMRGKK